MVFGVCYYFHSLVQLVAFRTFDLVRVDHLWDVNHNCHPSLVPPGADHSFLVLQGAAVVAELPELPALTRTQWQL